MTALLLSALALAAGQTDSTLIRDLESSLMAPCCYTGTVANHGNPEMEAKIVSLVAEGKQRKEILDYFVGQYGARILAVPAATGFNAMMWIAPVVALLLGAGVMIAYLRQRGRSTPPPAAAPTPFDDEIERELKEFDA